MNKKQKEVAATDQVSTSQQNTQLAPVQDIPVEGSDLIMAELIALSDAKALSNAIPIASIVSSYVALDKIGDTFTGVFIGIKEQSYQDMETGEVKTKEVISFLNEGKRYVNQGAQLVNAVKSFNVAVGTILRITLTDIKR